MLNLPSFTAEARTGQRRPLRVQPAFPPAPAPRAAVARSPHSDVNALSWLGGGFVRDYRSVDLRPPEALLFARHRGALSGRVLELGCGTGRITGHLLGIARAVHGIDLAPEMLRRCRRNHPDAMLDQGDIGDLSYFGTASADAIVAGFCVIDVLDETERGVFLDSVHRILSRQGVLIFSAHNHACVPLVRGPLAASLSPNPVHAAMRLARLPRRLRNRRRLGPLQRHGAERAIVNDVGNDHSLLHHYITRDAQERELSAHGFELLECLDLDGVSVPPGAVGFPCHELHYAARPVG